MSNWKKTTARQLKVGDTIIRNVEPGFEWVPGPYGAFVVRSIRPVQDEFFFTAEEAWGGGALVKFSYDGDEEVTIKDPSPVRKENGT